MSGGIDRRAFLLFAPALALAKAAGAAPRTDIPLATDLRADGRDSRARKVPIVVLFSLPGCPYCEIVRRSHLAPMLRDPREAARAIIRQIDIDGDQAITGFAGERVTHAQIAKAHGVRAAPVVAIWDGDGKPIAEPLSGMLLPDFYSAYLDAALEAARARLAARN
jgi:thioredoxin-related protein